MQIWNITDVGIVRKGSPNEDTYMTETFEDGALIAAVFDGMGGANAGEVASNMASGCFSLFMSTFAMTVAVGTWCFCFANRQTPPS